MSCDNTTTCTAIIDCASQSSLEPREFRLAIDFNQKRTSFQTACKRCLNTSGAMKGRSMTERSPKTDINNGT